MTPPTAAPRIVRQNATADYMSCTDTYSNLTTPSQSPQLFPSPVVDAPVHDKNTAYDPLRTYAVTATVPFGAKDTDNELFAQFIDSIKTCMKDIYVKVTHCGRFYAHTQEVALLPTSEVLDFIDIELRISPQLRYEADDFFFQLWAHKAVNESITNIFLSPHILRETSKKRIRTPLFTVPVYNAPPRIPVKKAKTAIMDDKENAHIDLAQLQALHDIDDIIGPYLADHLFGDQPYPEESGANN